jgi:hypothetical protein
MSAIIEQQGASPTVSLPWGSTCARSLARQAAHSRTRVARRHAPVDSAAPGAWTSRRCPSQRHSRWRARACPHCPQARRHHFHLIFTKSEASRSRSKPPTSWTLTIDDRSRAQPRPQRGMRASPQSSQSRPPSRWPIGEPCSQPCGPGSADSRDLSLRSHGDAHLDGANFLINCEDRSLYGR